MTRLGRFLPRTSCCCSVKAVCLLCLAGRASCLIYSNVRQRVAPVCPQSPPPLVNIFITAYYNFHSFLHFPQPSLSDTKNIIYLLTLFRSGLVSPEARDGQLDCSHQPSHYAKSGESQVWSSSSTVNCALPGLALAMGKPRLPPLKSKVHRPKWFSPQSSV